MRNYIILNNKKSDTISGLIIQELPPISKPAQRTQIETIDGRDGDIVTPLGYAAYDKTFTIGLYGTFDINEIIAYFATQGQVIFSNEPNKYYNYQIVDQIDYERLVRYKVATVTMHVQPFKYSSTEAPIIVDSSDTVSGEGSNIALANTAEAPFNVLRHKGNATQKTIDPLNLFNVYDTDGGQVTDVSVDADGWLTCTIDNTSGTNAKYGIYFTNNLAGLQTSTTYAIVMEVKAKSGTGTVYPTQGSGAKSQMSVNKSYSFNDIAAGQTYIFTQATKADFTGTYEGLRTVVAFQAGQSGSITFRLSVLADTSVTPSTFSYLPFVGSSSSPNPDYPQDIQVVTDDQAIIICGKNLLPIPDDWSQNKNGLDISCVHGVYTFKGTASSGTSSDFYELTTPYTVRVGDYLHLGNTITNTHVNVQFLFTDGNSNTIVGSPSQVGRIISLDQYAGRTLNRVRCNFNAGYELDIVFKPMILHGVSTATDFAPYQEQSYIVNLGYNLFKRKNLTNGYLNSSGELVTAGSASTGWRVSDYIKIEGGKSYTLGGFTGGSGLIPARCYYAADKTYISSAVHGDVNPFTHTAPSNAVYMRESIQTDNVKLAYIRNAQNTPIELCAIGNYADEPVKVDGTWYIRRAIGKVVFDGSDDEGWWLQSGTTNQMRAPISGTFAGAPLMSDYFHDSSSESELGAMSIYMAGYIRAVSNQTSANDFKTWLSTHNTTVYYALATPIDEAITDQDLIDALDEFFGQAHAYKGQTNIIAIPESGNSPAVLSVDVNEDNESTVTNAGNTTSRPILTIYGQGDIGVYINDVEVLQVALGDEGYITLDSVEMEAYKDSTANLKNRLVTGDYSKLTLNAGANKIRFTGIVTKYEISKYSRWL